MQTPDQPPLAADVEGSLPRSRRLDLQIQSYRSLGRGPPSTIPLPGPVSQIQPGIRSLPPHDPSYLPSLPFSQFLFHLPTFPAPVSHLAMFL